MAKLFWSAAFLIALVPLLALHAPRSSSAPATTPAELVFRSPNGDLLRVDLLLTGDAAARISSIDAMRAAILRQAPALRQADQQAAAGAGWVENGYAWRSNSATFAYNAAGAPAGVDASGPLAAAAQTWNDSGANFHFTDAGATSADTGACGPGADGHNTIGWATLSGSTLAVTCTLYRKDGNALEAATEFDMRIDPKWEWTTGDAANVDLQSVVTHELGHALGLGHSPDPATVMFADYSRGTIKRALTAADIAGAVAIYGPTSAPPPAAPAPAAPAAPGLTLAAGANLVTWPGSGGPVAALLANTPVTAVYAYDPARGEWRRYIPGLAPSLQTLATLDPGQPYWVLSSGAAMLSVR